MTRPERLEWVFVSTGNSTRSAWPNWCASGQVSPAELLDEALARTAAVNPRINAVIHLMEGRARAAIAAGLPEGPFRGVPFLVKDLMTAVAGEPMRWGSRLFRDYVPAEDEELTRRYRRAGLVIFGKTNTPELGVSNVTEPELFGPTRNPWNLERTSSGSSGGSAAAVAARIVPCANANDGGGSIRTPASNCGLVGLKPSRGRNPTGPLAPDVWFGMIGEHAVTRSVRDSAALLDATAGDYAAAAHEAAAPGAAVPRGDRAGSGAAAHRVQFRSGTRRDAAPGESCRARGHDGGTLAARARTRRGAAAARAGGVHRGLRGARVGRRGRDTASREATRRPRGDARRRRTRDLGAGEARRGAVGGRRDRGALDDAVVRAPLARMVVGVRRAAHAHGRRAAAADRRIQAQGR